MCLAPDWPHWSLTEARPAEQRASSRCVRALLGPGRSPSLAGMTRSLAMPARGIAALWGELRAQEAPGYFPRASVMDLERIAATGFPFSDNGREALKTRLMRWNDSGIAWPEITRDNYSLTDFILDRLIAHAPDVPRSSDLAARDEDLEKPEFHRDIGKLAFHSWLMEVLGLSLHVEVEDFLPKREAVQVPKTVGLYVTEIKHAGRSAPFVPSVQARVMTLLKPIDPSHPMDPDDGHPAEAAGNAKYRGGCVAVTALDPGATPPFEFEQLDVDSTVEKILSLAQKLGCQFEAGVVAERREAALGTLRTTGLSLLAHKVDQQDDQRSKRTQALRDGGDVPEFYADDLIVGYRPDLCEMIPDGQGGSRSCAWKSLVARKLDSLRIDGHEFADAFSRVPADESFIAPHARMLDGGDPNQAGRLVFFEELFRWDGWSLAAPHIGSEKRINEKMSRDLQVTYESGGRLPRQRFGWGYRLGMRAAYLDGWGVSLAEAAKLYDAIDNDPVLSLGTDEVGNQIAPPPYARDRYFAPFLRYEAVQPAIIVEKHDYDRNSSERLDRLLVKSDGDGRILKGQTQRELAPPLIDVENAIRAGIFDTQDARRVPPRSCQVPDPWATRLIIGIYRHGDDQLRRFEYFDYYTSRDAWPNNRSLKIRTVATTSESLPVDGFDTRWDGDTLIFRVLPGFP